MYLNPRTKLYLEEEITRSVYLFSRKLSAQHIVSQIQELYLGAEIVNLLAKHVEITLEVQELITLYETLIKPRAEEVNTRSTSSSSFLSWTALPQGLSQTTKKFPNALSQGHVKNRFEVRQSVNSNEPLLNLYDAQNISKLTEYYAFAEEITRTILKEARSSPIQQPSTKISSIPAAITQDKSAIPALIEDLHTSSRKTTHSSLVRKIVNSNSFP